MDIQQDIAQNPTIFGKILRGEIPNNTVYEDDRVLAFHDIAPKAKVHVVVIPKLNFASNIGEVTEEHKEYLGYLLVKINEISEKLGVIGGGFRVLTNSGPNSGQEVPHLHFHILGGEPLAGVNG